MWIPITAINSIGAILVYWLKCTCRCQTRAQGPCRLLGDLWSGGDAGVGGLRPGWRFAPGLQKTGVGGRQAT